MPASNAGIDQSVPHPFLAVIGGGNMARAIVVGAVHRGVLDPDRVAVAEPDESKHAPFNECGVRTFGQAAAVIDWLSNHETTPEGARSAPSHVLLAVKPQSLAVAAGEIAGAWKSHRTNAKAGEASPRRVVVSILAGTPSRRVREALGDSVAVVRAMPNTPARLGEGVTALALGADAQPGDDAFAERLFRGIGPLVLRTQESLLDAYTAVSGSGPAYVFFLAEAMTRAAEAVGIPREDAERAVRQTIIGAATLLKDSPEPFESLRAAVTSKGGTTEAAVRVLTDDDVSGSVVNAIRAARDRGRELGQA